MKNNSLAAEILFGNSSHSRRCVIHTVRSVLIIDDHLLVRRGLIQLLVEEFRISGFGEAQTAEEALPQLDKGKPWNLVILVVRSSGRQAFRPLEQILTRRPGAKVLVLSVHTGPQYAALARQLGASGFLSKFAPCSELVRAFRAVLEGRTYYPQEPASDPEADLRKSLRILSEREYKVMLALAGGKRIGEIAVELQLNVKTVSTYRRRILDKLGLHSTADIVRYVLERNTAV